MTIAVPDERADGIGNDGVLVPLLLLAFGLIGVAFAQSDFFRAVPGDLGDTRFNGLILEHVFRWVRGIDPSLWSPGFFYPFPGALAFSDNHFGTVGAYMLLRVAGLTPEVAYTGWLTLAYAASYLCCHYALRRFGLSSNGSAIGAFLFAFAMPALVQVSHSQLGYRFAVPLAMLACWRLMTEGRAANLAWLGVWVTVQFYCSIYIGYFLLLLLGGYIVAAYLVRAAGAPQLPHRILADLVRHRREGGVWQCAGVLLGCTAALLMLLVPYIYFSRLYGFMRSPQEITSMLPRPASYLLADGSWLWNGFSRLITGIPMRHEQQMFFGAGATILAVIGTARSPFWWLRVSAIALLLVVLLTLDVGGYSFYTLISGLPLADSIRAVSRICLVMVFPLALLAGAGFDRLTAGPEGHRVKTVTAWLLVALLLGECVAFRTGRVPLPVWRDHLAALVANVPQDLPADAIVFQPRQPRQPTWMTELDGMSLGQLLDRNTLNGYSGNQPPGYDGAHDPCDDLADRLTGYVEFMRLDARAFDALARRVVMIGASSPCPALRLLQERSHFSGRLPDAMYRQIRLKIAGMTIANAQQLAVDLDVENRSDTVLGSISDSNQPIHFSWRFVPADAVPRRGEDWGTRSNLRQDVPPHADRRTRLLVDAPEQAGRYVLEVSLVQENVAWFHDKGMEIARGADVIEVSRDGEVGIGH